MDAANPQTERQLGCNNTPEGGKNKMKRIICILLAVSFLLGFSACGKTLPEETTSSKETGYVMRTQYSYPKDYNLNVIYSMENAVKDSNEYYEAISEAFPNRPVLAVICNSYFGEVYSTLLNDALNVWLEENGYNFAVMIYSFGINNLLQEGTFANKVKEFVEAGGKCDVIVTGANISSLKRIIKSQYSETEELL